MKKILLLEDDKTLGEGLLEKLSQSYHVDWAQNLKKAQSLIAENQFDLAILDVNLPDGSGFDIADQLKNSSCQFVFLTAQADAESRLKGFELGAQEFIPKPFFIKELMIRVAHVLEIHTPKLEVKLKDRIIRFEDMSIQHDKGNIEYPPLTDMKVLKFLVEKAPHAVSRDEIFDAIWGADKTPNLRTVDNIVVRLRTVLGDEGEDRIRSIRGVGYQWINNMEGQHE